MNSSFKGSFAKETNGSPLGLVKRHTLGAHTCLMGTHATIAGLAMGAPSNITTIKQLSGATT